MEQMTSMYDMVGQLIRKKEEEKRIEEEQASKDRYWKIPVCYDDDDDKESSIPLKDIISELPPCVAITPDSPKTNSSNGGCDSLWRIEHFSDGDGSIPHAGIESDDFNSEEDDNSTSCPEFESFHVDYPDSGDSTIDVMEDIPIDVPNILPTHPAL
ncbi:hypothetical protein Tco_0850211 [Tanacetum coccineum]